MAYKRTISFTLTVANPSIANLLTGTEFAFVTADSVLSVKAVIDPPAAGNSAQIVVQRQSQGATMTLVNGSQLVTPVDGVVGSGPNTNDDYVVDPSRVSATDSLILALNGVVPAGTLTGRVQISLQ